LKKILFSLTHTSPENPTIFFFFAFSLRFFFFFFFLKQPLKPLEANNGTSKAKVIKPKAVSTSKPKPKKSKTDDDDDDDDDNDRFAVDDNGEGASRADQYQKLSLYEQIMVRPDTYVGSIERTRERLFVFDAIQEKMVERDIEYVPGLFKIFDEILVNAADNYQRDSSMTAIKVDIDAVSGTVSVWNNGAGIPIERHKVENMMVPEMIFGNLLTSSNYNDAEKRVTGGRNGFGAKLTNIFSSRFECETADARRGKKYHQVWTKNMSECHPAKITELAAGKDYTKITFTPDLSRFGMTHMEADIVALMTKRVYDIAGCLSKVKVTLNGKSLAGIRSFLDYCNLYILEETHPKFYERVNERWEVCISISNGQPQQVSFVNAICTSKGGTHVQHVLDKLVKPLQAALAKKKAVKDADIKPHQIKQHIFVFVNCLIENPVFESQTKDTLTLQVRKFGSACDLSEAFVGKVLKSGLVDVIAQWAQFKQKKQWERQGGPKARGRVSGIAKLDDANDAGSSRSQECTLILTEGDSAKSLAQAGIAVVGADSMGCFPLRGKLLNVRDASIKQLMANEELNNLITILGLKKGETYTSTKGLRYGHLMIMADQDHDGSHIKGLIINMFHKLWPSLLKVDGFMQAFLTPIVKATRGREQRSFFSIPAYNEWKAANQAGRGWKIKYYKGLGTSTDDEAKEYFANIDKHQVDFRYGGAPDDEAIELAFAKQHADRRKEWMAAHDPEAYIDHRRERQLTYKTFVDKELVLFSVADCARSIPCVVDGLKAGQRKVLYVCLKRKLVDDFKVAQLAGAVANKAAYHHGEQSLQATIVNMAQHYVGAHNVNLLYPAGMFGTRRMGGKDAASARYIYTRLSSITRTLFREHDDAVLEYLDDDGYAVEPRWYVPIIPMILVNGADGIGTGWSTSIPNFNPLDCVKHVRHMLRLDGALGAADAAAAAAEPPLAPMTPWYKGFTGSIVHDASKHNYRVTGVFERLDDHTLLITELPLHAWTQPYKEWLEEGIVGGEKTPAWIKDYRENHTENTVRFEITCIEKLPATDAELIKKFKLTSTLSTGNMVAFDAKGRIKKYDTPAAILREFYELRIATYRKRKQHLTEQLEKEYVMLDNKVRFIRAVIKGELVVAQRKKADLIAQLRRDKYAPFPPESQKKTADDSDSDDDDNDVDASVRPRGGDDDGETGTDADFNYLLSMALWSLTAERVAKLEAQRDEKARDLEALVKQDIKMMWLAELDELELQFEEFVREQDERNEADKALRQQVAKKAGAKKRAAPRKPAAKSSKAKAYDDDDDDDDDGDDLDLDDLSDDFERKPKAVKSSVAAAVAPKKPPTTTVAKAAAVPTKQSTLTFGKLTTTASSAAAAEKPKPQLTYRRDSGTFEFGDNDILSLSDSEDDKPKKEPAAAAAKRPAVAATSVTSKTTISLYDDDDDDIDDNGDFAPKSKPATTTTTAAAAPKKKKLKKRDDDDDDDDADGDDDDEGAFVAKSAPSTKRRFASATAVTTPKKKAAVAKPKPKRVVNIDDDDDDDDDDSDAGAVPVAREARAPRRAAAAAAVKTVDLIDSDDDGEESPTAFDEDGDDDADGGDEFSLDD
jgi:DNA topoisomerase-2